MKLAHKSQSDDPFHVAIIMDGNGRWAKMRGLPRTAGHRKGVEVVRDIVKAAPSCGITHLTLYGFSSENWRRPTDEVNDLMGLLRIYLKRHFEELHRNGVCIKSIGDRAKLPEDICQLIENAEIKSKDNLALTLQIALSYGGRDELIDAAKAIADEVATGKLSSDQITHDLFARHLYTHGTPDPDLLIRTSGEQRLSNFLLWQCAYTEFVFVDQLWPDFSPADLKKAIDEFNKRERRYGTANG